MMRKDRIRTNCIRDSIGEAPIVEKIRAYKDEVNKLRWFRHAKRQDEIISMDLL